MKKLYLNVYNKLINEGATERFNGSHAHRIEPGYRGGDYVEGNVVYLSQKEHSIVHWLRWKLWGAFEDKKAYKMIGIGPTGLSHKDRIEHGNHCVENRIGIHGYDKELKQKIGNKTFLTQKQEYEQTNKKNFYYWSTSEGRSERARIGGLVSSKTNKKFIDQQCSFKDTNKASLASQKSGKKPVTNGVEVKKFHTEEQREEFLKRNTGWRKGYLTKKEKSALGKLKTS